MSRLGRRLWIALHHIDFLRTTYPPRPIRPPERTPVATIGDILNQYESSASDAKAKADAAIAADKAASDAADALKSATATTATDLHVVGASYIQTPDGSIKVYSSSDGVNVTVVVPRPSSTVVPDPATTTPPADVTPAPPADTEPTA